MYIFYGLRGCFAPGPHLQVQGLPPQRGHRLAHPLRRCGRRSRPPRCPGRGEWTSADGLRELCSASLLKRVVWSRSRIGGLVVFWRGVRNIYALQEAIIDLIYRLKSSQHNRDPSKKTVTMNLITSTQIGLLGETRGHAFCL